MAEIRISGSFDVPESFVEEGHRRSDIKTSIPFTTTVSLHAESRLVRFRTKLDNVARDHRLRVLFETGCATNTNSAENAFAVVEREQKAYSPEGFSIEVPTAVASMQRFVSVEHNGIAATVVSKGLPEYELVHDSGGVIALTLLRCVQQLSRGDLIMRPGGESGWHNETPEAQCQGAHVFDYAFLAHGAPWTDHASTVLNETARFLEPLTFKALKSDDTSLDSVFLAAIQPTSLVISAAKEAEDGDGVVIRVSNPTPLTVDGELRLGWNPAECFRTRLDETPESPFALSDDHAVKEVWTPFEIKTFRFR